MGHGLYNSNVICPTFGWLKDASQTLEYGKNYTGYWTGELFVKQVTFLLPFLAYKVIYCYDILQLCEKIIPAFKKAHGPGYQALIMVDNSQGHSAYAEDALLVFHMNINPGRKHAQMHDGWYLQNSKKVIQLMNFPQNHTEYLNEPKGVKVVLTKQGLYQHLCGKCKNKCELEAISCCNRCILELQPDFKEHKSLIQEVIEATGHLCNFLPKFHYDLNFIEFF